MLAFLKNTICLESANFSGRANLIPASRLIEGLSVCREREESCPKGDKVLNFYLVDQTEKYHLTLEVREFRSGRMCILMYNP